MSPLIKIDLDLNGKKINMTLFGGMVRNLIYLTASRPYIMLSVCLCAMYQVDPKETHFLVVETILRYLVGTQHLGLWYSESNTCSLIGYSNANFIGSHIDRKSTSGACHFIRHFIDLLLSF